MPRFKIKQSKLPYAGKGCFAAQHIKKGVVLGEYKGKILTEKQRNKLKNDDYIWELKNNLYLDARTHLKNNPMRYVNGCMGLCQCKHENVTAIEKNKKLYYKSIKPIKKGEELIIDYGDEYFSFHTFIHMIESITLRKAKEKRIAKTLIQSLFYIDKHFRTTQFNDFVRMLIRVFFHKKMNHQNKFYPVLSLLLPYSINIAAQNRSKIIRKKNTTDIYMYIYAAKQCSCSAIQKRFHSFLKKHKRNADPHNQTKLNRYIKQNDYRSIQHILEIYSFIQQSKLKWPKNKSKLYQRALKDMRPSKEPKQSKFKTKMKTIELMFNSKTPIRQKRRKNYKRRKLVLS